MIWEILNLSRLQKMLKYSPSGKHVLGKKLRFLTPQPFAENLRSKNQNIRSCKSLFQGITDVLYRPSLSDLTVSRKLKVIVPQPQTQEVEKRLSGKDLQIRPVFYGENPFKIQRRPTKFLRKVFQQKHFQLRPKGLERLPKSYRHRVGW